MLARLSMLALVLSLVSMPSLVAPKHWANNLVNRGGITSLDGGADNIRTTYFSSGTAQAGSVPPHVVSYSAAPGDTYPWEGNDNNINTGNGNKLTAIGIVGWRALGGMPIDMSLYHNSQGTHNSELGYKWTFSYDIYLVVDGSGNAVVHWGDDLAYQFTKSGSNYTAPTGIFETFVANGSPITSYDLTKKDGTVYHFTNPNSTGWYLATITDSNDNVTTIAHDANDYLTSITDPTNRAITLSYDGNNRISTITDPASRQWTISYTSGNLTQVTLPTVGGNSYNYQFGYNANHCITSMTDPRGHSSTAAYYSDNSVDYAEDAEGNRTTYIYISGQTTITDENSHSIKHNYTSSKLSSVVDQLNNTETYTYDASYNVTRVNDRRNHNTDYTYDSNGNVLTVTNPLSKVWTYTYNSLNETLTITDPLSHYTSNTYDSDGNLTQIEKKTSSGGSVISDIDFTYNADGTMATKTDDNSNVTTYGYDSDGNVNSITTPNSHEATYVFNDLGVMTTRTDALSNDTDYTLDNWYRVTGVDYPTGTDPTYSYDANSNLTGWTDDQGTWARVYDNDDRMTSESLGGTTRVSYSYDASGKKGLLSTMTDSGSRVMTYAYTARDQIYTESETNGTTTYTYDNNGNETNITNPNSTTVTMVYDNANQLTSVTNKNSSNTTLSSFAYTYNDDGTAYTVTEDSGDVVTYGYDGADRLTSETRTGSNSYSKSYTLDGVGNRTAQTVGGTSTSFTINDDNEVTATSGGFTNSYTYNDAGYQTNRTLAGTSYDLTYDYEGQLTQISQNGTNITYAYDALGRQYSRTAGGTTTVFQMTGNSILLEKQGSTTTGTYSYGNDVIRRDSEYFLYDGAGTNRTTTASNQSISATLTTDAYANTVATSGSTYNLLQLPSEWGGGSRLPNFGDGGLMGGQFDPQLGRSILPGLDPFRDYFLPTPKPTPFYPRFFVEPIPTPSRDYSPPMIPPNPPKNRGGWNPPERDRQNPPSNGGRKPPVVPPYTPPKGPDFSCAKRYMEQQCERDRQEYNKLKKQLDKVTFELIDNDIRNGRDPKTGKPF
ncbi:MAG: DUF6531 domain-containing protein [Patescibacteria group bacterium]